MVSMNYIYFKKRCLKISDNSSTDDKLHHVMNLLKNGYMVIVVNRIVCFLFSGLLSSVYCKSAGKSSNRLK